MDRTILELELLEDTSRTMLVKANEERAYVQLRANPTPMKTRPIGNPLLTPTFIHA
jgi:hypothetical protein